jgi:hypothetical protein
MSDALIIVSIVSIVVACVVLPLILLVVRDARRHRLQEEQRPLKDRIAEIRSDAAFMADQLQAVLDRETAQQSDAVHWIAPVVGYYRKLEALAGAPDASAEEIQRLAEEASKYVRQHRLKGIFVAMEAERLAALVRKRNAA